jgi:hypothetical protein
LRKRRITGPGRSPLVQLDSLDRAGGPTCSRRDAVVSDGYAMRSAPPKNRVPEYLARTRPTDRASSRDADGTRVRGVSAITQPDEL